MVKTERGSERRRDEKWQTCWRRQDQQRACRMAQFLAEKLERNGPATKERLVSVPQREQLPSTPEPSLPKKGNRAVCPEHQIVRWKKAKVCESRKSFPGQSA